MTSTNIHIGLVGEKNSSRVLRPPGGGHSDIFGIKGNENDLVTPSKKKNQPQSNISSCFGMADEPKKPTEEIKVDDNKTNGTNGDEHKEEEINEVDNGTDENKAPAQEEEEEKKDEPEKKVEEPTVVGQQKRGRVPPGGYSTGFW